VFLVEIRIAIKGVDSQTFIYRKHSVSFVEAIIAVMWVEEYDVVIYRVPTLNIIALGTSFNIYLGGTHFQTLQGYNPAPLTQFGSNGSSICQWTLSSLTHVVINVAVALCNYCFLHFLISWLRCFRFMLCASCPRPRT
jgi:hypothetical protein